MSAHSWNPLGRLFDRPAPPKVGPNTFFVWEPCTHSHAEVVPGFVRYLLDLGYEVCVCMTPARYDEGLFSRFDDPRLQLCRLSQPAIVRYFKQNGLSNAAGVLITTARKISGAEDYAMERRMFAGRTARQRLLLVEHDVRGPADRGALTPDIITLRRVHYRDAVTTVVNPHFFGRTESVPGSEAAAGTAAGGAPRDAGRYAVRFITIGALRGRRRNAGLLIEALRGLHESGARDFKVTVIGRGSLRGVPPALRPHLEVLGRVDFRMLYAQMERADFFLPLLDPVNPAHDRYLTTGTSGSFQLIYGFRKPCLIARKFAQLNGFDEGNALLYEDNAGLTGAMGQALQMSAARYKELQGALGAMADALYAQSRENLRRLIAG